MTLFLSYLLDAPVYGRDGLRVGKLGDFVVEQVGDRLPTVTGLVLKRQGRRLLVPMADVAAVEPGCLRLQLPERELAAPLAPEDVLLLKRDLLDAQVVDTNGAKVVRVNDILLSQAPDGLRVGGLDIGLWGLVRRWGLAAPFARLVRVLRLAVPEGVVAWDTTQPIDKDSTRVQLKVSQDRLVRMHPADLADVIEEMGAPQRGRLYEALEDEQLADLIEESEPAMQTSILRELQPERAADVLEEMEPDEAADVLGGLPEAEAEALIQLMEPDEAAEVRHLLTYEADTAGAHMTTSYLEVPEEMSVAEALAWFRDHRPEAEVVAYFYLVDAEGRLTGVVSSRRIMLARDPGIALSYLASSALYSVKVDTPVRDAADLVLHYHLTALPVVDDAGKLVGVITVHDVLAHSR